MLVIFNAECSLDHYKSDINSATSCTECPDHSHTESTTSNSILQCICDTGYQGPDGGPCTGKNTVLFRPFTKHLSSNEWSLEFYSSVTFVRFLNTNRCFFATLSLTKWMIILVVTCPVLESPSNGVVASCGNEYQSVCNLTCDPGHIVSAGDLSRECLSTGFWTGEPLKCNGKAFLVDFWKWMRSVNCKDFGNFILTSANTRVLFMLRLMAVWY